MMAEKSPSPDVLSMALSSAEQERDSLQEKVDHLKILLKQYQQELQSQKIRKEGVETVSKLLQESRQENNLLQKRNKTLETAIRNLQSRLANNGLSNSITLEEGDMFIPGTSKQLLDNLARENARLRTLVKNASVDPEEITKLHQIIKDKISENESLQQTLSTHQIRVAELEQILNSSESQKDVEISHLRNTIQNMHSDSQTRDVLCHSLAEETVNLRSQLRDVAARCQEMAIKLDHGENTFEGHEERSRVKGQTLNTQSEELERLRDEALLHKSRAEEVTKMNKRWQEYNSQREKYVQHLENTIKGLERNLQAAQATQVTPGRSHVINSALEEAKRRLTATEQEKKQLELELQERNRHLIQQAEQIDRLQSQLASNQGGHHSDTETIEALKAQIQICTEDFESERRDREKAQDRLDRLEKELKKYKDRERFQPKLEVYPNRLSGSNQEVYPDFNQQSPVSGYQYEPQLAARGISGNVNRYNVADGHSHLQTDSEPMSTKSCDLSSGKLAASKEQDTKSMAESGAVGPALSLTVPSLNDSDDEKEEISNSTKKGHTLNCPKCNQEFPADKHGDLLEHIEMCCD